mmetsp:Transcript_74027/g.222549  ORF Transcript_74027/g.222549 Transcript_74027/m.222549 type:complete len:224 (+) Transcript_74027:1761-2432(+)
MQSTPPRASLAKGARSEGTSRMSGRAPMPPALKLATGSTARGAFSSRGTGTSGRNWRCCSRCDARRGIRSRGLGLEASAGAALASSCWPRSMSTSSDDAATLTPPRLKPAGLGSRWTYGATASGTAHVSAGCGKTAEWWASRVDGMSTICAIEALSSSAAASSCASMRETIGCSTRCSKRLSNVMGTSSEATCGCCSSTNGPSNTTPDTLRDVAARSSSARGV